MGIRSLAAELLPSALQGLGRIAQAPQPLTVTEASTFAALTDKLGYLSKADLRQVRDAYKFADEAHLGQFRASGEPYITHPLAVAGLVADWRLDAQAVMAALMHDALEDCGITKPQLIERFGAPTADLVDGLTKLDKLQFSTREESQAESFRKMLLAMARDVRVILIKLADRLHNMRTMKAMPADKRQRIARETLDIYAPIAHRLGLNQTYRELQELSFEHLYPWRHGALAKAVSRARGTRRDIVERVQRDVQKAFAAQKIKIQISGREKTIYSIYRKMREKHAGFAQVNDIFGFRIVVPTLPDCYLALGVLHQLYKPVPGRFKDYIAIPKANGYQSLHTTLVSPLGTAVEFQIRTEAMHAVAEKGIAAHWLYKTGDKGRNGKGTDPQHLGAIWLQSLVDIQDETRDAAEFLEHVKIDLYPDAVYVFTPKSKILALPRGATPVDFAYSIHTDIGNKCVAARVNGEIQPLRTELRNGDVVEIVTGPVARPNPSWLAFVRTGKARAEIRHFLRTMKREESVELGERLLAQAAMQLDLPLDRVPPARWEALIRDAQAKDRDEILADIGLGRRLAAVVARQLLLGADGEVAGTERARGAVAPVVIRGTEGMAVQMANCCSPIPGDAIVGHMRKDQGLAVHQADCANAQRARRADPERWIDLQWADETSGTFAVNIDIGARNQRGVLGRIAVAIAEADSNILNVHIEDEDAEIVVIHFKIQVRDRRHLARVVRALRRIKQVSRVLRVRSTARSGAGEEG